MTYDGFGRPWYGSAPVDGSGPGSDYDYYSDEPLPTSYLEDDYPNTPESISKELLCLGERYQNQPGRVDQSAARALRMLRFRYDQLAEGAPEVEADLEVWELNFRLNTTLPWHQNLDQDDLVALLCQSSPAAFLFFTKAEDPDWRGVASWQEGTLSEERLRIDGTKIWVGDECYNDLDSLLGSELAPDEALVPRVNRLEAALELCANSPHIPGPHVRVRRVDETWQLGKVEEDPADTQWHKIYLGEDRLTLLQETPGGTTNCVYGHSLGELSLALFPGLCLAGLSPSAFDLTLAVHEYALPMIRQNGLNVYPLSPAILPGLENEVLVFPDGRTVEKLREIASGSFKQMSIGRQSDGIFMAICEPLDDADHLTEKKFLERRTKLEEVLEGVEGVVLGETVTWQDVAGVVHVRVLAPLADGNLEEMWPLLGEEQRRNLLKPLLKIVADIHERNVIHRDLSATNFLLFDVTGGSPVPGLTDWDTGTVVDRDTVWQSVKGTPPFMAPEIARSELFPIDEIELMKRAEVFSIGMIMWTLYTGTIAEVAGRSSLSPRTIFDNRGGLTYEDLEDQGFPTREEAKNDPILALLRNMCNPQYPYGRPTAAEALRQLTDLLDD